jgi:hypothetical protein
VREQVRAGVKVVNGLTGVGWLSGGERRARAGWSDGSVGEGAGGRGGGLL